MKAKFYRRKDTARERWIVYLNWKGKAYARGMEDDGSPIESERRAFRLSERINGAIETYSKYFDPRFWFRSQSELRFSVYAREWLERQRQRKKPYSYAAWYNVQRAIRKSVGQFQDLDIREINAGMIEDFYNSLPTDQNNVITYLRKLFKDAYRRSDIHSMTAFPPLQTAKANPRWITRDWQDKIISELDPRDRPIFEFLKFTGARIGEARALMWDSVDFDRPWKDEYGNTHKGVITIRRTFSGSRLGDATKTGFERELPMTEELRKLLQSVRGIQGFVFRTKSGRSYTKHIAELWNEAKAKAKCPYQSTLYQDTRHSKASQLASEGVSLRLIAALLGHSSVKTTQRYAGVALESKRKLVE